jgi:hypothetical protein
MDENKQDVDVRAVTKFGLGLTGGVIIVAFLMWFLFDRFAAKEAQHSPRPEPMQLSNPQKAPPEPRLQPNPPLELKEFRAGEDAVLNTYGWVDPEKGIVRIPVSRAIELVAKEGL